MATATSKPGEQNLRVLVVSGDPQLADEFRNAFERIPDRTLTLFTAESERDAADAARRRQPHLSFVEVGRDLDEHRHAPAVLLRQRLVFTQ